MKRNFIFLFLVFPCHLSLASENPFALPSPEIRSQLFSKWVEEIERLDGEGLTPRFNRQESWRTTTDKLKAEATQAHSIFQWVRAYRRLDATYPNLHAQLYLDDQLNRDRIEGKIKLDFEMAPQLSARDQDYYSFFVSKSFNDSSLIIGDEIIAINGVSIKEIQRENFTFCKFPLRSQCALELYDQFSKELLFWNREQNLAVTIKRKDKVLTTNSTFKIEAFLKKSNSAEPDCSSEPHTYQDFDLDYKGFHLCAYTSKKYPHTMVLRIPSFVYTPNDPISRLDTEVDLFWFNYWRKRSRQIESLIIDVIGNYGGNSPIPYYALFAQTSYQEQYVQFKKIREFERPEIYDSLFWGDNGKKIWFEDLKTSGQLDAFKEGDFLPAVPQFCRYPDRNCKVGLFEPYPHQFRGEIKVLLDQWCISSCVGFVDNLARLFRTKIKFYGHEDSGDSTYSRLTLALNTSNDSLEISLLPLNKAKKPESNHLVLRQVLSLTRSTNQNGEILSGKPQKITQWIPRSWNEDILIWSRNVFRASIKDENKNSLKKTPKL